MERFRQFHLFGPHAVILPFSPSRCQIEETSSFAEEEGIGDEGEGEIPNWGGGAFLPLNNYETFLLDGDKQDRIGYTATSVA